jgi:predicted GH43/DUF377 family glycosyl hydrolase
MERMLIHSRRHPDYQDLLVRHPDNPILNPEDWPYPVNSVFNPGVTRLVDTGETLLLTRVEERTGLSHLCAARSVDGIRDWRIDAQPTLLPERDERRGELWGIEDPRITWVPSLKKYAVAYTSYSRGGPGVALALTRDFLEYEHYGMIMPPEDKDAALFPRRFGEHWAMIHRPVPREGAAHIWISFSPDLRHWGSHQILFRARMGGWWDARKIGLSPPPIETSEGWLIMYHGVRHTASGAVYRVGLALLDLEDPTRVIYRSSEWIFGPLLLYERIGDVQEVVFPTGYVLEDDNDSLRVYYGAADTCIGMATAKISELLAWLKGHHYEGIE